MQGWLEKWSCHETAWNASQITYLFTGLMKL